MAFYDIFEGLCEQRGVTPTRAARENDIAQSSVATWKKRGSTPKAETVQKLADYFGVSVDYLLGIRPLPLKEEQIVAGKSVILESADQEFFATSEYIEEMGYKTVLRLGPDNPENKWTLYDVRSGKEYLVSAARLTKLSNGIVSFTKFSVSEMISELTEIPRYRAETAPQSPPASTEGKDTTPPPDAPEGAEE